MEGNKDDAAKCLRIAKDALQSGDRPRALKFLNKARRLDPSLPIDDLVSAASGVGDAAPDDSSTARPDVPTSSSSSSTASSSATRSRPRARVSPSDAATGSASSNAPSYTEEHIEIVREVKRKQKDYYSILGLEKSCTVEDVRKAYRKLSLKVHPDKNNAPGAEEAFKSVSKAFQCLSNEESRRRYDLVGSDEPVGQRRSAHRHGHDGFYGGDFDADEIFRNFFGGMAPANTTPFGTFHFRTGGMGMNRAPPTQASGSNTLRLLVQILPVIILLLLNFLPSSEPIYALSRTYPYDYKIQTARGVPYYVKSANFEEEYPYQSEQRVALERRIEREYVGVLTQNCRAELQRRHWGMSYQTPHCDLLNKYEQASAAA